MKHLLLIIALIYGVSLAACNNPAEGSADSKSSTKQETKEERNIRIAKAAILAMNKHNVDEMLQEAAPDFVDYGDGSMTPIKNPDSTKLMMDSWLEAFPDFKAENEEYFASGDKVVVLSDQSGTWSEAYMGMKPSGKKFQCREVDIFTFNDSGKVVSHRSTQAMAPVMASVGLKVH